MPEASATVLVRQPLTTVWEYCLIPEHVAALTPGVIGVETVTDGPVSVGTVWRGQMKGLGRAVDWTGEFTRVDAHTATEFSSTESPLEFAISATFAEVGRGVELTYRIRNGGVGGAVGKLADALAIRAYQRSLAANAKKLPRLVDEWAATR